MIAAHHVLAESRVQIATQTTAVSYSEVACVTLLTWDIIVSMADEVELIWKKQWTPGKGMYLFARYLPWAFQVALLAINVDGSTGLRYSTAECKRWMAVQAVMLQLIITAVDVILVMRVYALYNKNTKLLAILSVLFAAEISFLSYVLAKVTPRLTFNDDCFVTSSPPIFVGYWITSLVFETILFVLTLIKFVDAVRKGWGRRPVMREFVSDGTWAYTLIFVTMFVNSMLYKLVHSPLAGVCFTWLLSVLSFAGSRLVLNPRRRTNRRDSIGQGHTLSIELVSIPLSPVSPLTPISHMPFSPSQNSQMTGTTTTPITPITPITPTSPRGLGIKRARQSFSSDRVRVQGLEPYFEEPWEDDEGTLEPHNQPSNLYTLGKPDFGVAL